MLSEGFSNYFQYHRPTIDRTLLHELWTYVEKSDVFYQCLADYHHYTIEVYYQHFYEAPKRGAGFGEGIWAVSIEVAILARGVRSVYVWFQTKCY